MVADFGMPGPERKCYACRLARASWNFGGKSRLTEYARPRLKIPADDWAPPTHPPSPPYTLTASPALRHAPRPHRHLCVRHAQPGFGLSLLSALLRISPHDRPLRFASESPLHTTHSDRASQPTHFPLPTCLFSRSLELPQGRGCKRRHSPSRPLGICLETLHQLVHPRVTDAQQLRHPQLRPRLARRSIRVTGTTHRGGPPGNASLKIGGLPGVAATRNRLLSLPATRH